MITTVERPDGTVIFQSEHFAELSKDFYPPIAGPVLIKRDGCIEWNLPDVDWALWGFGPHGISYFRRNEQ